MKIAFIGDSFCSSDMAHSWTDILAKNIGADIICRGKGGMSIGQAYFDLVEYLDNADMYFMLYTDHRRLFNSQQYPLNTSSCLDFEQRGLQNMLSHDVNSFPDADLWDAGLKYFKHIYHQSYHELVHELIIKRCDEILARHILLNPHKKVYHFHCFPAECTTAEFESGPCCRETMFDLIDRHGINIRDMNENHMSVQLNAAVAERISMLIKSDVSKWFDLP